MMKDERQISAIREKLLKIKALADSGIAGEQDAAMRMLLKLTSRSGISLESLNDQAEIPARFSWRNSREKSLLVHIVARVIRKSKFNTQRIGKSFTVQMTTAQSIEVQQLYDHYRRQWAAILKRTIKTALNAFIVSNSLYFCDPDRTSDPKQSAAKREELRRIARMVDEMRVEGFRKRLQKRSY